MQDMEKKYKEAQLKIQLAGVVVLENVMSCCRSCALAEMDMPDETNLAWTFAGQGNELVWKRDRPFTVPEMDEDEEDWEDDEGEYAQPSGRWSDGPELEKAEDVYWYHSGGLRAPEAAAKAFRDAGFEVVWDGSEMTAVLVKFP